jgi:hypothetical protein
MSNIPENMRAFSLDAAKSGHPLTTRAGREVKFIAHVPDSKDDDAKVVAMPNGERPYFYYENGKMWNSGRGDENLFLAPLGYVEGKSVFVGDKLLNSFGNEFEVSLHVHLNAVYVWGVCSWPSQKPVVETQLTDGDINCAWKTTAYGTGGLREFANIAIARAIADGDVIPTEVVEKIASDAFTEQFCAGDSFKNVFKRMIQEYKNSLKGTK